MTNRKREPRTPSSFELFTGGKDNNLPYAIYYNLAYDNLFKYVNSFGENIRDLNFSEKTFLLLKEYFWKGLTRFQKNADGESVTVDEKQLIKDLIAKLEGIRNFHSHYWHDNKVLAFSVTIKDFINNAFEIAVEETNRLEKVNDTLFMKNKRPLFNKVSNEHYISQEGRLFFLSFFLSKGDMESLLQQTTGSKGNSTPEMRFKRKAYTHYCHREGSTWITPTAESEENYDGVTNQKGIMAFKLINYLKDHPIHFCNSDFMPLWTNSQKEVESIEDLLNFIDSKGLFAGIRFSTKDYSEELSSCQDEKDRKKLEDKKRVGYLIMSLDEDPDFEFDISYPTLYQITLECFFRSHKGEVFIKTIKSLIDRRQFLYQTLKRQDLISNGTLVQVEKQYFYPRRSPVELAKSQAEELGKQENEVMAILDSLQSHYYSLDDLVDFPIGAQDPLKVKIHAWKLKVLNKDEDEKIERERILNKIRPISISFNNSNGIYKKEPQNKAPDTILYNLAEFHKGENEKPRNEDRFLEWAARYISDFGICPNWEFAYEEYTTVQAKNDETRMKKKVHYACVIPGDKKVKIMQNNLLIRSASENGKFHYFMVGKKAMTYMLYWLLLKNNTALNMLLPSLCKELGEVEENGKEAIEGLQLYEQRAKNSDNLKAGTLPPHKISNHFSPSQRSLEVLLKKMQKKIAELNSHKENLSLYSRYEINNYLLDAYKLYDFTSTVGQKYLRKNEYQLLSVVHYMLNQIQTPINKTRQPQLQKNVKPYLDKNFKVNGTTLGQRIPKEIYQQICCSKSLKDLFENVIDDLLHKLTKVESQIKSGSSTLAIILLKNSYLERLLPNEDPAVRKKGQEHSYPYLPNYVDPNLVIKYFDKQGYEAGSYHPKNNTDPYTNIYSNIRKNQGYTDKLWQEYYTDIWEEQMLRGMNPTPENAAKIKKLRNWLNKYRLHSHSEDVLVYIMALNYLRDYNADLGETLAKTGINSELNVKAMFAKEIVKAIVPNKVFYSLRIHQTDDYFYRTYRKNLKEIAIHYIKRIKQEIAYYSEKDIQIKDKLSLLPTGNKEQPIPLGLLLQERKIVANYHLSVLKHLWEWEKSEVMKWAGKEKSQEQIRKIAGNTAYLSFDKILEQSSVNSGLKTQLRELRNLVLHSLIPETPFEMGIDPKLKILLDIPERLGRDKTAENPYVSL